MATSLKISDALKGRVQHLASQRSRSPCWIIPEATQQTRRAREGLRGLSAGKLGLPNDLSGDGAAEGLERCPQ